MSNYVVIDDVVVNVPYDIDDVVRWANSDYPVEN